MDAKQLKANVELVINANLMPYIHGAPAIGKSEIVAQIAKEMGAFLIDLRLAQLEPQDLAGLPFPDEEAGMFSYLPLNQFPLKGIHDKPKKPVIIFLDELSSCPPDTQVAAYKLVLDRMVGEYHLHDNVILIGAGNREQDGAVVVPMSSALRSRMVHFELQVDVDVWLEWANVSKQVDERVIAFINYAPGMLSTFDTFEEEDTLTYSNPRTLVMLSKILKGIKKVTFEHAELINGIIGVKAGSSFTSFVSVYNSLPSFEEIIKNPRGVKVSNRGDVNIATVTNLNTKVKRSNIKAVTTYVNRMNLEYQTLFYQTLVYSNKLLLISAPVKSWISNNPDLFN